MESSDCDRIMERLARHAGETGISNESMLQTFDRVLLDHEKFHHGADVDPERRER